ncbi:MAG TPA: TssQ family T6SS-associated lipoprotein [Quisquiliibacterium sp.]|nr:TssQ family T6SS-associated lipoprotein [Quisquiliibacterium sp.]HQD85030.1 TssQ family T6SS-associated lipoprotein [Quisquiliibacterium sp.]
MTRFASKAGIAAIAAALVVAGCASAPEAPPTQPAPAPAPAPLPPPPPPRTEAPPPVAQPAPAPAPVPPTPAELRLKEAGGLYDAGNYNGTIRKLAGARDVFSPDTPVALRIEAHKKLAFSYCVTGRRALCRTQFDLLLKLDPEYTLSAAEIGHPQWGPVFKQAKAASDKARAKAKPRS